MVEDTEEVGLVKAHSDTKLILVYGFVIYIVKSPANAVLVKDGISVEVSWIEDTTPVDLPWYIPNDPIITGDIILSALISPTFSLYSSKLGWYLR